VKRRPTRKIGPFVAQGEREGHAKRKDTGLETHHTPRSGGIHRAKKACDREEFSLADSACLLEAGSEGQIWILEEGVWGEAAKGGVEELDGVEYGDWVRGFAEGGLELENAAGIAGGDYIGVKSGDEVCFAIAEFAGGVGLDEIIDARGAAADRRFGNFKEFEAGDLGEQLARLRADALGVLEMAGIVEGDTSAQGFTFGARWKFGKDFGDVAAFGGETAGAVGVGGIVAEKMTVFLDVGAATGGIDDDGVNVSLFEDVDGGAGELEGLDFFASVDAERAAAGLFWRRDDFATFGGEDADGGGVDIREKGALDAAEEEADAFAFFAFGGGERRDSFDRFYFGEKSVHRGQGFGEEFEETGGAKNRLQAGFLVGQERPPETIEARWFGEGFEEHAAMETFARGAMVVAFDLGAGGFDEFSVFDAGGARRHAGDATEAGVEVADPGFVDFCQAFVGGFHEMDAAARGVHFFAPKDVGGAGGKAEAAVDAFFDEVEGRGLVGVEGGGEMWIGVGVGHEFGSCCRVCGCDARRGGSRENGPLQKAGPTKARAEKPKTHTQQRRVGHPREVGVDRGKTQGAKRDSSGLTARYTRTSPGVTRTV
jgi:hypothetical protein